MPISKLIPEEQLKVMKLTGENPHNRCSGQTLGWALSSIVLAMTQPQTKFYLEMEEYHRDHGARVIEEVLNTLKVKHMKLDKNKGAWSLYYDIWRED